MSTTINIQKSDGTEVQAFVRLDDAIRWTEDEKVDENLTIRLEKLPSRVYDCAPLTEATLVLAENWSCWKDSRSGERYYCSECDYSSSQRAYIRQHVDVTHCDFRPFKCPLCEYAGKRSHALREHMLLHSRIRPYKCDVCSASFRKKNHLTTHRKTHARKSPSSICPICKLQVSKLTPLTRHIKTVHNDEAIICDHCDYFTRDLGEIEEHIASHGNIVTYKCAHCNFSCKLKQLIESHVKEEHHIEEAKDEERDELVLKCSVCGFLTPSRSELKEHMSEHIESQGFVHDEGLYRCTICSYTCELQRTIKAHIWKHSGHRDISYPCFNTNEENATVKVETSPKRVETNDGGDLVIGCQVDVFSSEEKDVVVEHNYTSSQKRKRNESEDERVAIAKFFVEKLNDLAVTVVPEKQGNTNESCGSSPRSHSPGISSSLLEVAETCLQRENGKKNSEIKCSLCSHKAESTADLEKHTLDQHCRLRTFKCKACSASFYYKNQLRIHMSAHDTGEIAEFGSSKCSICNRIFDTVQELEDHVKADHNTKDGTLQCSQCDFVAISSRALKSHQKRHKWDARYVAHPLEQYKCALCGYVCHHLPSLKSHMWRHSAHTNYSYAATNDAINAALDGRSHPHTATLVTFRCCQCGYETDERQELTEHMITHQDIIEKTLMINKAALGQAAI